MPDFCTRAESAAYLRCSPATLDKLIAAGSLASIKRGRARLIPATALRNYLLAA